MGKEFWGDFSRKLRRMVLIHKRRKIIITQIKIKIIIMKIKIIFMVASDNLFSWAGRVACPPRFTAKTIYSVRVERDGEIFGQPDNARQCPSYHVTLM